MRKNGYTLIEIMAAVFIFFLVTSSLAVFFTSSLKSQKEILASQEMVDNISYVMEYMSRALRMAKKDDLNGINCLSGLKVNYEKTRSDSGIKFVNYDSTDVTPVCQEFYLLNGRLMEWKSVGGVESTSYLTSESISVDHFTIGSSDSWDQSDDLQPEVTIYVGTRALLSTDAATQPTLKVQTSISQRNLDVAY